MKLQEISRMGNYNMKLKTSTDLPDLRHVQSWKMEVKNERQKTKKMGIWSWRREADRRVSRGGQEGLSLDGRWRQIGGSGGRWEGRHGEGVQGNN